MSPFYLAYSGLNARPIMEACHTVFTRADPNLSFVAPHLQTFVSTGRLSPSDVPVNSDGKIRVGIISRHFRWHSIGKFMRGIVRYLPRSRIELYVVFPTQSYDGTSKEIEQTADKFVRVSLQLRVARQQIAALRLHALLYADIGMESFTYYLAFSRLAPVQMVTHGHPCTTGLPSIDYFVSFEEYEPQSNQKFYSETLVRIPGYSSRYIRPPQSTAPQQNRTAWGFTADDHIYMAPQSLFKFHPLYDQAIAGVLSADPHGKMAIIDERHEGWAARVLARLRAYCTDNGVDPAVIDRLVFIPRVPNEVFLNYLKEADVLLDPNPFGGDTSTREVRTHRTHTTALSKVSADDASPCPVLCCAARVGRLC
jgi:protein O-GlcNAc transferase